MNPSKWKAQHVEDKHAARARSEASQRRRVLERAKARAEKKAKKTAVKDRLHTKNLKVSAAIEAVRKNGLRNAETEPLSTEPDDLFLERMSKAINNSRHDRGIMALYMKIAAEELKRREWDEPEIIAVLTERVIFEKRLR